MRADARSGPTVGISAARRPSATPLASAASGPSTAASARSRRANATIRSASVGSRRVDTRAMRSSPGLAFGLATKSSASARARVAPMACSRAPPPTKSQRMTVTARRLNGLKGRRAVVAAPRRRAWPRRHP